MNDQGELDLRPSLTRGGLLHASCVAFEDKAVLLVGKAGSGKSSLALDLISRGATLVADDQVILTKLQTCVVASCPASIVGKIEARGVGILQAETTDETQVYLVIDLDNEETERLPAHRTISCLGISLPLLFHVPHPHFAPAILQFLAHGRDA